MSEDNAPVDVTPAVADLSKVRTEKRAVTAREKATERKRRERALKKQTAVIEFIRTDASLFLLPDRLSQKAGTKKDHLRRMAIKELVDNGLDEADTVTLESIDQDTFVVTDDGPGIIPAKVVTLFSVTRPMMSSKLIRRPTRGAVGNGLRVATGAAFASGGRLVVESRGVMQDLSFDRSTGETVVVGRGKSGVITGTKITIHFGPALPRDTYATFWGDTAIRLSGNAAKPMLTHPSWYSEAAFKELVGAARGTATDLASLFGIDLRHASVEANELAQTGRVDRDIDPDGAANQLTLGFLKSLAPSEPKLIPLPEHSFAGAHRIERITASVAGAAVPAIVQSWAIHKGKGGNTNVSLYVNRTPTDAELTLYPGGEALLGGCCIHRDLGKVPKGSYSLHIAVTTPAVALINDGKTPDLTPFGKAIGDAAGAALRKVYQPTKRKVSFKDAAFEVMEEAYLKASAGGTLPANARQIMYAARRYILERTGQPKLTDSYFTQTLLPAYLDEFPEQTSEWDVVYDARGHLVEPHTGYSLPLGTLRVRAYLQPRPRQEDSSLISTAAGLFPTSGPGNRYGAVLFIEKEGFEPLLRAAKIGERFDIAVMSTKGMSVVAARALIDRLSAEGTKILVAHDLDITGIRIFGTLGSDSNRYRFKARPNIRRLGLTLDQAESMGLQSERQAFDGDYDRALEGLRAYGASDDEIAFVLGGQRVELNAMPSDQFIQWLEAGLRAHGVEKVIPPAAIIEQRAREVIALQHLKEAVPDIERAAREYADGMELPSDLPERIRHEFENDPLLPWEHALDRALEWRPP